MKKNVLSSVLILSFLFLLSACGKDDSPTDPSETGGPDISSFSPTSGPVGTNIFITGQNFGTSTSANTVKIGNTTATVTSASATEIFITVPEEASTGNISVTVDGKTDTAGTFTVTGDSEESVFPTFNELSQETFSPGDILTITGSGFNPEDTYIILFGGDVQGQIIEITQQAIQVEVPEGASSGDLTFTLNDETISLGILNIGVVASYYIFDYTQYRLGEVDIQTGDISFIGNDIPFGFNDENAVVYNNKYIGFQTESEPLIANPNIVSIDLNDGAYVVTPIADIGDQIDFDDFVVDSNGKFYIFHDSDVHRLAEVNLNSGELTYVGQSTNPNYGSNTRGAVYHTTNNEYIGFTIQNENFEDEPHLERFNLDTGETITVNIPESFLEVGNDFEELVIDSNDQLYIFHTSANMLAKIDIETGALTYIEGVYDNPIYGKNTRGSLIYDNQFIGFNMYDDDFLVTEPNIVLIDLDSGEYSSVILDKDALPESINLTSFAIKK